MSTITNLKKFDILGLEMGFEFKKTTRYKTWTGSFLSYLALIATIVISFIFGSEVYERKIPNISNNQIFSNASINLKDFKFWMSLSVTSSPNPIKISDYFDISINSKFFNISTSISNTKISAIPCAPDYFGDHLKLSGISASYNFSFCPNHSQIEQNGNYYFQNPYQSYNSSTVYVSFSKCNSAKRDCPDDIELIFSKFRLNFNYINTYIDNSNYKNPVVYYMDTKSIVLSEEFLKRDYISFTSNSYSSDNGWMLEDIATTEFIGLSAFNTDIDTIGVNNTNLVYIIYMDTTILSNQYKRSYMKIQDLFAKIGGVLNCLIILVNLISYHYIYFSYCIDIFNSLLDNNEETKISELSSIQKKRSKF